MATRQCQNRSTELIYGKYDDDDYDDDDDECTFAHPHPHPHGTTEPSVPGPPHYQGFTIILRHTVIDTTPLDE
jgi:hypothetical protein